MASAAELKRAKELLKINKDISNLRKGDVNVSFSATESLKELYGIRSKNSEAERESLKNARAVNDALLIAARVLGYGKDYEFTLPNNQKGTVDLSLLNDKNLDTKDLKEEGINEFEFTLPHSKTTITFKLLTHSDEKTIDRELAGLKKINNELVPEATTRLKYTITSVDASREKKDIREFVDNYLLARDARTLREEIRRVSPDVELKYYGEDVEEAINIPIDITFFWPDIKI